MGILIGYSWKRPRSVVGVSGEAVNNYITEITVDYVAGKMRTDFGDIRFTQDDGETELDYYLKSKTDGVSAEFKVEIGNVGDGATVDFFLYAGNSGASTTSDGDNTFPFFDDFNNESIDPTKWATTGAITEEAAGYLRLAHTLKNDLYAQGLTEFSVGTEIVFRGRFGTSSPANNRESYFGIYNSNTPRSTGHGALFQEIGGGFNRLNRTDIASETVALTGSQSHDTWYELKIQWHSDKVLYFLDGANVGESTTAIPTETDLVAYVGNSAWLYDRTFNDDADWVYLRPLASTAVLGEPALGAWGDWEQSKIGSVSGRIGILPMEELTAVDDDTKSILASEIRTRLFGDIAIEEYNPVLTGAVNGFEDKSAYHIEAQVNGNNAITTKDDATMVFIQNTGKQYLSSSADGIAFDKALKITLGGATLSILDKHEPFLLKDDNAGIDASGLRIETVETDGSTIASGTGLAVEFLAI